MNVLITTTAKASLIGVVANRWIGGMMAMIEKEKGEPERRGRLNLHSRGIRAKSWQGVMEVPYVMVNGKHRRKIDGC